MRHKVLTAGFLGFSGGAESRFVETVLLREAAFIQIARGTVTCWSGPIMTFLSRARDAGLSAPEAHA